MAGISQQAGAPRVIRIFLSTPSDVDVERVQLAALIRDINDTVQFVTPEKNVRLELVYYETHAYPDIGRPQQVIDRQLPENYDIYLGVMWKRCGTPTKDAPSGTVHEFNRARDHREKHGWPIIMFYFCDEKIPVPTRTEDVEQLAEVVRFREQLTKIGYTVSYPLRAEFREYVRPQLLRALAGILSQSANETAPEARKSDGEEIPTESRSVLEKLAIQYLELREKLPSGPERTRAMTAAFAEMLKVAPTLRPLLEKLKSSSSAGQRLMAVAILNVLPETESLDWLAERLDPSLEKPFLGYQAAVALTQAVRTLPLDNCDLLGKALQTALEYAKLNPTDSDRIEVLQYAMQELDVRCGKNKGAPLS